MSSPFLEPHKYIVCLFASIARQQSPMISVLLKEGTIVSQPPSYSVKRPGTNLQSPRLSSQEDSKWRFTFARPLKPLSFLLLMNKCVEAVQAQFEFSCWNIFHVRTLFQILFECHVNLGINSCASCFSNLVRKHNKVPWPAGVVVLQKNVKNSTVFNLIMITSSEKKIL